MYDLPITVMVGETEYAIRKNADYRVILDVIAACQDSDFTKEEQAVSTLIIFYECVESYEDILNTFDDIKEASKAMMNFIGMVDEDIGYKTNIKLIDWIQDEKLIVSAVNNVSKQEVRAVPYMHWWTFLAHYMAIGDCSLSTIVGIRNKIARGKKLEKYEQEFKSQNPEYFIWKSSKTFEETQMQKEFEDLWKSG